MPSNATPSIAYEFANLTHTLIKYDVESKDTLSETTTPDASPETYDVVKG